MLTPFAMGEVRVRRSWLPVIASVLMILLGVGTLIFVNRTAGVILVILGLAMYVVYDRLVSRSVSSAKASESGTQREGA